MTQSQMADLFQTSIPNVSMHIRNIFREGELQAKSVVKDLLTTAADGKRYRTKLEEFLQVNERDILRHAGRISHEAAVEKARSEYEKFRNQMLGKASPVERHFIEAVEEVKNLSKPRTTRKARKQKMK